MTKQQIIQASVAFLFLALFALFVYPTLYVTSHYQGQVYRVNRFTGIKQYSTRNGWNPPGL
jgi:hypothetical protein